LGLLIARVTLERARERPVESDPVAIDRRPRSLVHMLLERADEAPDEDGDAETEPDGPGFVS
jgi:hypothetical protein